MKATAHFSRPDDGKHGFTLMELMTALVIIGILLTLMLPAFEDFRAKAGRTACIQNLRSLHVTASSYLNDHHQWPQVSAELLSSDQREYERAWVQAFAPYHIAHKAWICPTIQRAFGNPDYTDPELYRIDYQPMPFDDKEFTPRQWPNQPWFVEKGDAHGNGNLVIFLDGSVQDLNDIRR